MPLLKRVTEPVYVSRGILPEDVRENGRETATLRRSVPNELECVTNGTLASVVRQLSSLSKQAENLFGELHVETCALVRRSNNLQGRIDRLAIKVTQLDSNVEEVSLHDIHMRKAFKSSTNFDQQVLSRDTIPTAMLETYEQCDKPPPLDKLNPYREDGKDGLKFYTDPNYFFDLWRQEMLKDTERIMHDKGRKPHRPRTDGKRVNRKVRQPHNTREMYLQKVANQEFLDGSQQQYGMSGGQYVQADDHHPHVNQYGQSQPPLRPNSLELHANYSSSADIYGRTVIGSAVAVAAGSGSPATRYAAQQQQQQPPPQPPAYVEHPQYTQYQPPPPYTPTPPDAHMHHHHTPTRQISRTASNARPSHPPPAPPPGTSGSGGSTPSHSGGTPSGARSRMTGVAMGVAQTQREGLPPPPPPPAELSNGPVPPVAHYVLQKVGSLQSRSSTPVSPGGSLHEGTPPPPPLSQLNNTPDSVDLPPPPPTPDKGEFIKGGSSEDQMPSPPPPIASSASSTPSIGGGFQSGATVAPPPPPPPMPQLLANGPVSSSSSSSAAVTVTTVVVPNGDVGRSISATDIVDAVKASKTADAKTSSRGQQLQPIQDPRSDLLAAIREGIKLRKVEDNKAKEVEKQTAPHDVASILARRVAMEFSDSDTASESEYDSDVWDDDASN